MSSDPERDLIYSDRSTGVASGSNADNRPEVMAARRRFHDTVAAARAEHEAIVGPARKAMDDAEVAAEPAFRAAVELAQAQLDADLEAIGPAE